MDSPPSRSGGRNELSDEGVARWSCWSGHRPGKAPPQPSLPAAAFPRQAPPPPEPRCCRIICTSDSAGDSANIVVLLSTQLLRAIWACNHHKCKSQLHIIHMAMAVFSGPQFQVIRRVMWELPVRGGAQEIIGWYQSARIVMAMGRLVGLHYSRHKIRGQT